MEHHSLVPEYHLVHLTHHLSRRHVPSSHQKNQNQLNQGKTPHEKTRTKPWRTETEPPSLLNDEMFVRARETIKDVDLIGDLNKTVELSFDVSDSKSSESDSASESDALSEASDAEVLVKNQEEGVHKIELEAFGKSMKLVLRRQEGLLKKDGLKMWNVLRNESQPHGVDYEEMKSVSLILLFVAFVCRLLTSRLACHWNRASIRTDNDKRLFYKR